VVAGIDCGSNSTRLLILGPDGSQLERLMSITRLGQGVDATGRLDPAAMERTFAVLRSYRERMAAWSVEAVRASATSAVRDAANREEFLAGAEAAAGVRPELLSGASEGRLSFAGATDGLAGPAGCLVVDIGGGSTELAFGRLGPDGDHELIGVHSIDMGCVRLTERFQLVDPIAEDALDRVRSYAADQVEAVLDDVRQGQVIDQLIGVAGTVTTLAAVDLACPADRRDLTHHHRLSQSRIGSLAAELATCPLPQRRQLPGMEPGRAEVIVAGAAILAGVVTAISSSGGWGEPGLGVLVSEHDILDGLAASAGPKGSSGQEGPWA
jgi:exopolyphosphatase/guanosine-5'-triphosphate,3'-diphosphate pyrophosphatase